MRRKFSPSCTLTFKTTCLNSRGCRAPLTRQLERVPVWPYNLSRTSIWEAIVIAVVGGLVVIAVATLATVSGPQVRRRYLRSRQRRITKRADREVAPEVPTAVVLNEESWPGTQVYLRCRTPFRKRCARLEDLCRTPASDGAQQCQSVGSKQLVDLQDSFVELAFADRDASFDTRKTTR